MAETAEYSLFVGLIAVFLFIASVFSSDDVIGKIFPLPTPTPLPTPSPAPNSLETIITEELKKLTNGQIVFNPPATMKQGEAERIEARITAQDIGNKLVEGLEGRGIPETENIKVANSMKVVLSAEPDRFQITRLSTEEQVVTGRPYAQWEWNVTPLSFGAHSLHLKATATLNLERFGEKFIDVPIMDKQISVRISPIYLVTTTAKNLNWWQILFGGGGLVALVTALLTRLRQKKKLPIGFWPFTR